MLQDQAMTDATASQEGCRECRLHKTVSWIVQIAVAGILAQTLFFKFTYAPETQVIFGERGGRLAATAVGIVELICVILLLIPRRAVWGAILAIAVMGGAIFTHLTSLGIEITDPATGNSDGGLLFALAVAVALGSMLIVKLRWRQLPFARNSMKIMADNSTCSRA